MNKKDANCAKCAKPIRLGQSSKPAGEAKCRGCCTKVMDSLTCACGGPKSYPALTCEVCAGNAFKGTPHTWFHIPQAVRLSVFARDDYVCQLCGSYTDQICGHNDGEAPTIDHIIPRSKGGTHEIDNLRTAHRSCNGKRGNRA